MSILLDGTGGVTTPAETVQGALTTTGNTILGDATTDTLNVGAGGLVKDASGNVGIGTSSPASPLDLKGKQTYRSGSDARTASIYNNGGGAFCIGSEGADGITELIFNKYGGTEAMRIDSSGNVGIGNVSPTQKLVVAGGAQVTGDFNTGGRIVDRGIYTYVTNCNIYDAVAHTYKIAKFSTHYWGIGGYVIEIWQTFYANFGYSKYAITGSTAGVGELSLTQIARVGSVPIPTIPTIAINAGYGYGDLRIVVPGYYRLKIKITSPEIVIQTTNPNITTDDVYVYPDNTVV